MFCFVSMYSTTVNRPIQSSESRPSMLLENSEYMISVKVHAVPVAPATRYFVLVLKITRAHTQG